MKAMRVVPTKTYQHPYSRLLAYTMCPVWSMHLLTLSTLHHIDHSTSLTLTPSLLQSDQFADHLSFSGDPNLNTSPVCMDTSNSSRDTSPEPSEDEESSSEDEDFPTVPMDDEHWTTELAPERTFCIHENGLPNNVCSYPCPYRSNNTVSYIDSLDLSDVSDLEDHFLTTSDEEELPGLEEVPY